MRYACADDTELYSINYALAATGEEALELYVDACEYGWGCVLAQRPAPGKGPRPVGSWNKSFSAADAAWSAFERERESCVP